MSSKFFGNFESDSESASDHEESVARNDDLTEKLNSILERVESIHETQLASKSNKKGGKKNKEALENIKTLSTLLNTLNDEYTSTISKLSGESGKEATQLAVKIYTLIDAVSKSISITHSDASKLKSLLEKSTELKAASEKSNTSVSSAKPDVAKEKKAASAKKSKWLASDDEEEQEEKEEEPKPIEKKPAAAKKSKWFAESDEEEEEEEEEEEKPKPAEKKPAPQKKSKWFAESDEEEEEEEEEKPKPVEKKSASKKSKWFADSDEEEEEEEKPKPVEKKTASSKKSKWFADSDEEEEEEKPKPAEKKPVSSKKNKWFADSDEEEEEEEEEKPKPVEKKPVSSKKNKWFADSDEEEEEEEEGKEESDETPAAKPAAKKTESKRSKWFEDSDNESASGEDKDEEQKPAPKGARKEKGDAVAPATTPQEQGEEEGKPKELNEMNAEEISSYLDELRANRAKKGAEGAKQVKAIEKIIPYAKSDEQKITVLLAYFEASFDTALRSQNGCMSKANWNSCMRYFREVLTTVEANKAIRLNESEQTNDSTAVIRAAVRNKTSVFKGTGSTPGLKTPTPSLSPAASEGVAPEGVEIGMSPFALLQHFADDLRAYNRGERAEDSTGTLVDTALLVKAYYERLADAAEGKLRAELLNKAALVGCLIVENTYFIYEATAGENTRRLKELTDFALAHLQDDQQRAKARMMLCGVYSAALHDDYVRARNDFVGSRIQETIASADASTQVLYFRALAQLGLAAFRKGHIPEAHGCLAELWTGGGALAAEYRNRQTVRAIGARELLGQGMVQVVDKQDKREEFAEQQRQVPANQHISLSLIEDVHLLTAMLLEVPLFVAQRSSARKYQSVLKEQSVQREQVISPTIRKLLSVYDQMCCKPSTLQTRDLVMVAADCMRCGDWEHCVEAVEKLSLWTLLPQQQTVQTVKTMVVERIKVECFRCFLFARANYYSALSIDRLAARFGLAKDKVKTLTYKMIISERFDAHVDYQKNAIIPTTVSVIPADGERSGRRMLPTKVQTAALRSAESLFRVCENACKLYEAQFGKTVPDVVYKKKTFTSSVVN